MGRYRVENESAERHEILNVLARICVYLHYEYEENHLNDEVLHDLPIDVFNLSLENERIDAGLLSFFEPLDETAFENLSSEMVIPEEWPEWPSPCGDDFCDDCLCDCNSNLCNDNFTAASWVADISSQLWDSQVGSKHEWCSRGEKFGFERDLHYFNLNDPQNQKQWALQSIYELCDESLPHVGGRLLELAEMHDKILLRSEVLSIVALMIQKMTNRNMISHRYVPVYIISHAGMKVRILVAYFDKGRLKIQKSDIVEFGNGENMEGLKTIARWTLCRPIGDTAWKIPVLDPYHAGKYYKTSS